LSSLLRRSLLTFLIFIITAVVVAGLVVTRPKPEIDLQAPVVTRVEVVAVEISDLNPRVELTGVLRPRQTARLRFEVQGTLVERRAEPGLAVVAGELLLQLEEADYQDALTEAQALLDEALAGIARDRTLLKLARESRKLALREVQRLDKLGEGSLASASNRDSARQQLLQLESEEARLLYGIESGNARMARLQASLSRAQRNLQRTRLKAPFSGQVNRVMVEVGDLVQSGSDAAVLLDTGMLELDVEVTGEVALALSLGQSLMVSVDGAKREGFLVALQPDPDPQTHTHPARVRIPADGLSPGLLGRVSLPLGRRSDVLVVPISAVLREEGKAFAFVVQEKRIQRRQVREGIRYQGRLEIIQGLHAGEQVVARDIQSLSDGIRVEIENL